VVKAFYLILTRTPVEQLRHLLVFQPIKNDIKRGGALSVRVGGVVLLVEQDFGRIVMPEDVSYPTVPAGDVCSSALDARQHGPSVLVEFGLGNGDLNRVSIMQPSVLLSDGIFPRIDQFCFKIGAGR